MTKTLSSRERLSPREQKLVDLVSNQQQSDESSETTSKSVAESSVAESSVAESSVAQSSVAESSVAQSSVAQSTMQPPVGGLQIVHATTGRVRIRATDGSHNSILETISQNLRKQDGVREVWVNQETGSLIVNFDEKKLSLPQMLERLQQFNIDNLPASPQGESKQDPFAAWKSPDFWKEQGISFIPMFTGLAVTGGLGISGLASIGVYYITANATRRVIHTLQHSASETSVSPSSGEANSDHKSPIKRNKTDQPSLSKVEHKSAVAAAQPAKIAYSVVHAIPGRIRLNVPRVAGDRAYARRLERLLKTEPQVTNVRVNCDAASVAITYKAGQIPVSHWVGLMQLADKIIPQTNPIKTTTEQPLPKPVHQSAEPSASIKAFEQPVETPGMWSDFKTPALSTALCFMANFPLDPVPD